MVAAAACLLEEAGLEGVVEDDQQTSYDSSRFVVVICLFAYTPGTRSKVQYSRFESRLIGRIATSTASLLGLVNTM